MKKINFFVLHFNIAVRKIKPIAYQDSMVKGQSFRDDPMEKGQSFNNAIAYHDVE